MSGSDLCAPGVQKEVGDSAKVGQGNAMKNKWIKKEGTALVPATDEVQDATRELLHSVEKNKQVPDPKTLPDLRKRKLVTTTKHITYTVAKGSRYAREIPVEHTDLTTDMLQAGSWKTATFKPYNLKAQGAYQTGGALHPINKVRSEFRDIFFNVGFTEMPTNR